MLILVAYSVGTTFLLLNNDWQAKYEDLSYKWMKEEERHLRLVRSLNDELFESDKKCQAKVDSLIKLTRTR